MESRKTVSQILSEAEPGDPLATERLLPLVYDELHRLADARLRGGPPGQTLQATALVHEVFLRLVDRDQPGWENRGHFFFAAARAMRDILVERARRKASLKRGGDWRRAAVDPDQVVVAMDTPAEELLTLEEALAALEDEDPHASQLVLLRFFAGLTEAQTAEVLGMSARSIRREWRYVRARLHQALSDQVDEPPGPATR